MDNRLAISVLDLVGMRAAESVSSAIARSVDLAQHVEQWGYKRYWLAEHHAISGLACAATAVLIGRRGRGVGDTLMERRRGDGKWEVRG